MSRIGVTCIMVVKMDVKKDIHSWAGWSRKDTDQWMGLYHEKKQCCASEGVLDNVRLANLFGWLVSLSLVSPLLATKPSRGSQIMYGTEH